MERALKMDASQKNFILLPDHHAGLFRPGLSFKNERTAFSSEVIISGGCWPLMQKIDASQDCSQRRYADGEVQFFFKIDPLLITEKVLFP
ncbi:hypothetical protein [Sporolactobacillus pectinivorans]|uniref:hypothetical protein n=1 Tax=Sporolactobacillus pectinivorans TaxID=1591408 RepID=UPI00138FB5A6|nr:hypothetical protein [Sporolactobacillus pectinivorans]